MQVAGLNNHGADVLGAANDEKSLCGLDLLEILLLSVSSVEEK